MAETEAKVQKKGSLADYVGAIKRGDTLMAQRDFALAAETFAEASAIRPEMYEAHYKLGNAYLASEQLLDAMHAFQKAYDRQPQEIELLLRISEICYRIGDYEKAAILLSELLTINDRYLPALCILPELLMRIGKIDDALELLKKAIPEQPHIPELWLAAGIACHYKDDKARAKIFYEYALSLNPKLHIAEHNLEQLMKGEAEKPEVREITPDEFQESGKEPQ
jgi:tetratricopeptide (TPR) repeat protein